LGKGQKKGVLKGRREPWAAREIGLHREDLAARRPWLETLAANDFESCAAIIAPRRADTYLPAVQPLSSTQRPVDVCRKLPACSREFETPIVCATRGVALPIGRTIEVTRPVELSAGIVEPPVPLGPKYGPDELLGIALG